MRPSPFLFVSAIAGLALVGCSANVSASGTSGETADADSASANASAPRALVSIESLVASTGERKGTAVARFVRARDGVLDEDALRMVHASLALPAVGSCAAPDVEPKTVRGVTLADLGSVSVVTSSGETSLAPRELPDVADLVSGVVYTSSSDGSALATGSRYAIHASGGDNVPAFVASANAPNEIAGLHLGDAELGTGGDSNISSVSSVDPASALDFSWDAGDSADVVYIDIAPAGSETAALRCSFADAGHASIAADSWASVLGSASGTVTLHRLHREPLRASGIDTGEVRFDFARAVSIAVASR